MCRSSVRALRVVVLTLAATTFLSAILQSRIVRAASGTWTNAVTGGLWSATGNWSGGTVANGTDANADFSTLNIAADNTVHLDTARTIGNLLFGDTTPSNNWILDNNSIPMNVLTLGVSSGTPTITVSNQSAAINTVLAGTQGFQKNGAGTLTLSGSSANSYSGTTTVNAGTLILKSGIGNSSTIPGNLVIGDGLGGPSADVVQLGNPNQISDSLASTVTINSSGLLNLGTTQDFVATLIFNGGAVSTGIGASQFLGFINNMGQVATNANAQTATIGGALYLNDDASHFTPFNIASGTTPSGIDLDVSAQAVGGGITKTGAGTLRLSNGTSTYANGTQLNGGMISVGADTVGSPGAITSGPLGTGTLTMAGGTTIISDGGPHTLANAVIISAGVAAVGGPNGLTVTGAIGGSGGLTKNGTGTLTLSASAGNAFSGNLTITNGNLLVTGGSGLTVGSSSPLLFGGGAGVDGGATIAINGGSFSPLSSEFVGLNGVGSVNQTGGTNNVGFGSLILANSVSSSGTYTLSGGNVSSANEYIGYRGMGSFMQSGGTNTISGLFEVGYNAGSQSTYTLSAGALNVVTNLAAETIGANGTGIFNQSGGTNSISGTNDLTLGNSAGSSGTYNLSGGRATIGRDAVVGSSGIGVLSVSATGSLTVAGTLAVANNPGTIVNLTGGSINTAAINLHGVPSLLNWTGGTLNVTSNVTWDSAADGTTTSAAFGASKSLATNQTLRVTGDESLGGMGPFTLTLNSGSAHYVTGGITINPSGAITQNANSTLYAATFTQAGGTVNGTLQNQGNFVYQSGAFNGRLLNQGSVSLGPTFTAGNGIENDASMAVAVGQIITANGAGIDNVGSFTLSGGVVSGTGPVLNDVGGTMQARGTINPALTNNGLFNVTGALSLTSASGATNNGIFQGNGTVTGNFANAAGGLVNVAIGNPLAFVNVWPNAGLVTLQGAGAVLNGGAITNTDTIQGAGMVRSSITNSTGLIRASGGELDLAGTGNSNAVGGIIQAATGNTVMVLQGLAANAGTIGLTGGIFDNNSHSLANASTGIINGYGTLQTGSLTNTGKLNVGEGNMDVYGNVTNNGTIGIQGGRFMYFFGNVNGSGSYTGLGTPTFLAAVSPGNSPASVSFAGNADLTSTSTLNIEFGGTTPGSQYDQLLVTGQLSIGGALQVLLINGFVPSSGNSFNVLDWGTLAGTFSSISLPTLANGLTWNTSKIYTTGVLSVISTLLGDYNGNGIVDAADYTVWRDHLGQSITLPNDTTPGSVTQADYDVWKTNFGNHAGSGAGANAGVAEPSTFVLLFAGILTLCCRRRPRVS
jgi:fibronectin-binding autotransporter adhesin